MEEDNEKYLVPHILNALNRVQEDRTVMYTTDVALGGARRSNPSDYPPLQTFGDIQTRLASVIFTKNSPLKPLFSRVILKGFESGQYDRLASQWQGDLNVKLDQTTDMKILTAGQVFMIFCFLMIGVSTAALFLAFEKFHHIYQKELMARNLNLF